MFKHEELIKRMTLEQKIIILSGKDFWKDNDLEELGLPNVFVSSVFLSSKTKDIKGTVFPSIASIANSWNMDLISKVGEKIGIDARNSKYNLLLDPSLNYINTSKNTNNYKDYEYFSEDPFVIGKLASAFIKGIEEKGIYVCAKNAISSDLVKEDFSKRAFNEMDVLPIEILCDNQNIKCVLIECNNKTPEYIDKAYEIINNNSNFNGLVFGKYIDQAKEKEYIKLINGFKLPENTSKSVTFVKNALAKEQKLRQGVEKGSVSEEEYQEKINNKEVLSMNMIDSYVNKVIDFLYACNDKANVFGSNDENDTNRLALQASEESCVLLKNESEILPLNPKSRIAIFGDVIINPEKYISTTTDINPTLIESLDDIIGDYKFDLRGKSLGYSDNKEEKEASLELVKDVDIAIIFVGLDNSSPVNIKDFLPTLPQNQVNFIKLLKGLDKKVIAVVSSGVIMDMSWSDDCDAVLHLFQSGQSYLRAALNIISGITNPSGKLTITYPVDEKPVLNRQISKSNDISMYVGYRYFDATKSQVRYPFGFGLSYSTFEYSDLLVDDEKVSVKIKNTSDVDGYEICQLYICNKESFTIYPYRELKGFVKVLIKANEEKTVEIPFDLNTFRRYDEKSNSYYNLKGEYSIYVGSSITNIRLSSTINVDDNTIEKLDLIYKANKQTKYVDDLIIPDPIVEEEISETSQIEATEVKESAPENQEPVSKIIENIAEPTIKENEEVLENLETISAAEENEDILEDEAVNNNEAIEINEDVNKASEATITSVVGEEDRIKKDPLESDFHYNKDIDGKKKANIGKKFDWRSFFTFIVLLYLDALLAYGVILVLDSTNLIENVSLFAIAFVVCNCIGIVFLKDSRKAYKRNELKRLASPDLLKKLEVLNASGASLLDDTTKEIMYSTIEGTDGLIKQEVEIRETSFVSNLEMKDVAEKFCEYVSERGLQIDQGMARQIFGALAGSKLVFVRNEDPIISKRFLAILADYLGNDFYFQSVQSDWNSSEYLLWSKDKIGDYVESSFLKGCIASKTNPKTINTIILNNVNPDDMNNYFTDFLPFVKDPEIKCKFTIENKNGKYENEEIEIANNTWFIGILAPAAKISTEMASITITVDINAKIIEPALKVVKNYQLLSYQRFIECLNDAYEDHDVNEESWKKIDQLEEYVNEHTPFAINNKEFRQMERYATMYIACNGDVNEAIDTLLANKLLLMIANLKLTKLIIDEEDFILFMDKTFDAENLIKSRSLIKEIKLEEIEKE